MVLYDLAGKEAAIATIDFKGLKDLATEILSLEKPEPVSETAASASESKRSCPACAARIFASAAFCPECGMSFATAESSPLPDTEPKAAAKSKSSPPPVPAFAKRGFSHPLNASRRLPFREAILP
jgi:hypothetical protein